MALATRSAVTLTQSFSFYVPATDQAAIEFCGNFADAVVVRGAKGPATVASMRALGWRGSVLFDRAGYELPVSQFASQNWLQAQADAGADRLLTPGRWVSWDPDPLTVERAIREESKAVPSGLDATLVLALDSRWVTKGLYSTLEAFRKAEHPIALILGHRGDPLSAPDAVNNLLGLTCQIPKLSILRSDHGAIGALAFGAVHGSVGLRPIYRHFTPPMNRARAIPDDRSPRVFVWDLMDWFTAFNVAGWGATQVRLACDLSCCDGKTIDRFLDDRLVVDAYRHNVTVLANLANVVMDGPATEQRRIFGRLCADAVEKYGAMGKISMRIDPKPQLLQWAQFA